MVTSYIIVTTSRPDNEPHFVKLQVDNDILHWVKLWACAKVLQVGQGQWDFIILRFRFCSVYIFSGV